MKWYVLTSIAAAGAVAAAGLGYYILKKRNPEQGDDPNAEQRFAGESNASSPGTQQASTPYSPLPQVQSKYPLQRGSRGESVRLLQQALITKFGASILPKYGADGSWGAELEKALSSKGLSTQISEQTFNAYSNGNFGSQHNSSVPDLTKPNTTASSISNDVKTWLVPTWVVDPKVAIGYKLFDAVKTKNFRATLTLLKGLYNVADYTSASKGFQFRPFEAPLRRYTLVNGLLTGFSSLSEKQQLRDEFRRMGLKETVSSNDPANYESTWSLSGLGKAHRNLRTTMQAIITDGFNIRVHVPARTLLGQWMSSGNGFTKFKSPDGRELYVRTNAVVFA